MPDCTLGELIDRILGLIPNLTPEAAMNLANKLIGKFPADNDHIPPKAVLRMAESMGYEVEWPEGFDDDAPEANIGPEITFDPVEVLAQVYRNCQRCIPLDKDGVHPDGKIHIPVVGRAPKESVFYDERLREQIEALPDDIKVLIGGVDMFEGAVTFTLYDEANDIDRKIGPIDLTRYRTGEELEAAIMTLLGRLERNLAADWN